jgi:hypothetical protein
MTVATSAAQAACASDSDGAPSAPQPALNCTSPAVSGPRVSWVYLFEVWLLVLSAQTGGNGPRHCSGSLPEQRNSRSQQMRVKNEAKGKSVAGCLNYEKALLYKPGHQQSTKNGKSK